MESFISFILKISSFNIYMKSGIHEVQFSQNEDCILLNCGAASFDK